MTVYITTTIKVFEYLAENGDPTIHMKMEYDPNELVITFKAYEGRSLVSRLLGGILFAHETNKPWSTQTSYITFYPYGNERTDVTPSKITKFETITVKFSNSSRGAYDKLFRQYHNIRDNVKQSDLMEMLRHLCNPNVTNYSQTSMTITDDGEFFGHQDRQAADDMYGYGLSRYFYRNYKAVIHIA